MIETENQGVEHKGRWTSEQPRPTTTDSHPVIVSMNEADLRRTPPPIPPRVKPRGTGGDLPIGLIVDGLYELDVKLGAGGMGEIYAARHRRLGKRVAIKVLGSQLSGDDDAISRFMAEARTLARIQHPAIVTVEHVGELADGRTYFVMEYLHGESLFDRLAREHVPAAEALCIIDQIARALEAAHACGVVHRDLKPDNIFLVYLPGEAPIVKLLDFGLSKLVASADQLQDRDADGPARQTQSGVAAGTPRYMAPEQMRGDAVDHRADVYALGCVAYELLLDATPFPHARTLPEFYTAHLNDAPILPRTVWPEIPPQIDETLLGLLSKDPADRPTLAQTRAVIAAIRGGDKLSRRTKVAAKTQRPRKLRRLAIVAVSLATLAGGVTIQSAVTARAVGGSQEKLSPPLPIAAPPTTAQPPTPTSPPIRANIPAAVVLPALASSTRAPETPLMETDTQAPATPAMKPKKRSRPQKILGPPVIPAAAPEETSAPPQLETPVPEPEKSPAPIDRNQTMNPFAKKPKVTP